MLLSPTWALLCLQAPLAMPAGADILFKEPSGANREGRDLGVRRGQVPSGNGLPQTPNQDLHDFQALVVLSHMPCEPNALSLEHCPWVPITAPEVGIAWLCCMSFSLSICLTAFHPNQMASGASRSQAALADYSGTPSCPWPEFL